VQIREKRKYLENKNHRKTSLP